MRLFRARGRDAATATGADLPRRMPWAILGYDRLAVRRIDRVSAYERRLRNRDSVRRDARLRRGFGPPAGAQRSAPPNRN
jgi:hypothetical protein